MVHRVRIVNFQSIGDLTVDPGKLTVLSGPSNSGKSAFVRAVRVLVSNPRGDYYRRHDTTETRVGLAVSLPESGEEVHVNFWRAKQVRYTVERRNVEPVDPPDEEYTAVGTSVPDPVSSDLAIDPDLQVSDQFDPPYLLGLTGSAVAKELGAITRADLMMRASHKAGRNSSDSRKAADTLAAQASQEEALLEQRYGWYPDAATAFKDTVWPLRAELVDLDAKLTALRSLRARLEALGPVLAMESPDMPDEGQENELARRAELLLALRVKRHAFAQSLRAEATFHEVLAERNLQIQNAEDRISELREQIPTCPSCGQPLVSEHAHA